MVAECRKCGHGYTEVGGCSDTHCPGNRCDSGQPSLAYQAAEDASSNRVAYCEKCGMPMNESGHPICNVIPNSAATTPAEQRLQREHEAEALRVTKSPFGTVGDPKSPGHTSPNSAANFVPTPFEAWGQPKLDEVLAPMLASTWWNGTDPLAAHYACMAMLQALIEGGYDVVAT